MRIEWTAQAVKEMRKIPSIIRERIIAKAEAYAADPAALANNVKQLAGSDLLRLRVGDYRLLFRVEGEAMAVMVVLRVRHRRDAYD